MLRMLRPLAALAAACLLAACQSPGAGPRLEGEARDSGALADSELQVLNRGGGGAPSPSAGQGGAAGVERFIDRELRPAPAPRLPAAVQAQIDALTISQRRFPSSCWISRSSVKAPPP